MTFLGILNLVFLNRLSITALKAWMSQAPDILTQNVIAAVQYRTLEWHNLHRANDFIGLTALSYYP
jgi:hypothetical protein